MNSSYTPVSLAKAFVLSFFFVLLGFQSFSQSETLTLPVDESALRSILDAQAITTAGGGTNPGLGPLAGPDTVCAESDTVIYTVTTTSTSALTYYWSLPNGWTIISGQGTKSVRVLPGLQSGYVGVFVIGYCVCAYSCMWVETEICGNPNPFPVELMAFSGSAAGQDVVLRWTTASEENNSHFVAERSTDGKEFTAAGTIEGKGTSNSRNDYAFTDQGAAVASGTRYYRLQQVDFDGTTTYSKVVAVKSKGAEQVSALQVSPVPANQTLNVSFSAANSTATQMRVVNQLGSVVFEQRQSSSQGQNQSALNISQLQPGIYFLQVGSGKDLKTVKFIKN